MPLGDVLDERVEAVAKEIVDAAYRVHHELGPGLLESVYEACLYHELRKRGLGVSRQVLVPIHYDGLVLDDGLRIDLLVENCVVIEVKAAEKNHPVFQAQLLTYLKLADQRLGLLINFNVEYIKDGIKRIIR
ncbi:MAG TPA: GxxExxY protein [Tepidisphaeraceae bacterium]|nr:GxxExxY protein [Tepidisphaeraceae bacterium]